MFLFSFVEFRYNLGNGPAILTSIQRLSVNSYHRIVAKRYQKDGILQVDGGESVAGQSEGTLKALDLNDSAFVGYVPISSNKWVITIILYDYIFSTQNYTHV